MLIQEIVTATSAATGITGAALRSHDRCMRVTRPRQVAMFLATRLTSQSLPAIGRAIGKRDHTTVLHANRRIEAILAADDDDDVADTVLTVLDILGVTDLPPPRRSRSPEQYRASRRKMRADSLRSEIARVEAVLARLNATLSSLSGAVP